ncbi:unnamed protein product [Ilex paraguariensis]|uniref:Uncharacterized protein n=1 Tax=Ilex paraguariensis TaxID=185542 RepID=A0ABC8SXD7_9AQUA
MEGAKRKNLGKMVTLRAIDSQALQSPPLKTAAIGAYMESQTHGINFFMCNYSQMGSEPGYNKNDG